MITKRLGVYNFLKFELKAVLQFWGGVQSDMQISCFLSVSANKWVAISERLSDRNV